MHMLQRMRSLRPWQHGAILGGLAVAGLSVGSMALGAAGAAPTMQVLPSPTGVKYGQTVEVKAQNLPKGSGTIAVTTCGLDNAAGQKIASPGADDCAGANELSSGLVKLQAWKDGTFDQQYTLVASGKKFGANQRFCDATHYCAVVVADANPSAPAYFVMTELQFTDQKPIPVCCGEFRMDLIGRWTKRVPRRRWSSRIRLTRNAPSRRRGNGGSPRRAPWGFHTPDSARHRAVRCSGLQSQHLIP